MEQEDRLTTEEEIKNPEIPACHAEAEASPDRNVENSVIDFSALSTEELIQQTQKLADPQTPFKDIQEGIQDIFEARYKEEYEKALAAFVSEGNKPEDFKYPDNRGRFYAIYKSYREKRAAFSKQIEAEREENLKIKLGIIEDLKALVQKEEALDKTFQEFRDIQERWRNTGLVPQGQVNSLLDTYHHHIENFYNYIKINKELRDLDLKRNLDAKTVLCEEAEKLSESNDTASAFKQLQMLHSRWKEIGPIPKEQKDALWERFRNATVLINEKYHRFIESLKQEQADNLKVKEEICEKVAAIAEREFRSISEWNAATRSIIDLQDEWKHSGTVPQQERNKIYKLFRSSCDTFFNRKREFYKTLAVEEEKNLELKTALCEKVEAIKDSTDWKATMNKIIAYQKEWKQIGPTPRKYTNKIWMRFRSACDVFFNNKNAHFKEKDSEQEKNLELKKALIEEARAFVLSGNTEEDIEKLKTFQTRWAEIGFVPIKEKNSLQEEFKNIIEEWFDKLNLDEFDRDLERFRAKLSSLDAGENKEFKIINEREKLVAKIKQLETDANTWENNIGFIAKSNKSQGLIDEMNSKIEKTRQKLTLLQEKLKALDKLI